MSGRNYSLKEMETSSLRTQIPLSSDLRSGRNYSLKEMETSLMTQIPFSIGLSVRKELLSERDGNVCRQEVEL